MLRNRDHDELLIVLCIASILFASPVLAVEHPGTIDKDSNCSSCHEKKVSGASVHSAMAMPCTVCHLTMTQGDMTRLTLLMPKERICSACHEESAAIRRHAPRTQGKCVECHDAHSSRNRLLLIQAEVSPQRVVPRPK